MFDKLQALARVMFIPTIALYLGGFICMTGYLGRFGIVTFDVVNARFLIAGLHVLLAEFLAVWISWKIYKAQLDRAVYTYARSIERYVLYGELLFSPYVASIGLHFLYGAADFTKMSSPESFHWRPWVQWDVAGAILRFIGIQGFGASLAFYLMFYGTLVVLLGVAIVILIHRRKRLQPETRIEPAAPVAKVASATKLPDTLRMRLILAFVDVVLVSLIISAGIDSWWRIRSEIVDGASLNSLDFDIAYNPLRAWFYATIFSILLFLIGLPKGLAQLSPSNFGQWLDPSNFADALSRFATPVLASMFLFGATIFPRIPLAIGGGMPRHVTVSIKGGDQSFGAGDRYLLGESSQFLFIVQVTGSAGRAFQINKDFIEAVQTWQETKSRPEQPHAASLAPAHSTNRAGHWHL